MPGVAEFEGALQRAFSASESLAKTVGNTVERTREGIGSVLLEGVATHAAALTAVRIQLAIGVSKRLPFATGESVCNDAVYAATEASTFAPYLVTLDTLFGDPVGVTAFATATTAAATATTGVGAAYGAALGPLVAGQMLASRAGAILMLLGDLPADSDDARAKLLEASELIGDLQNTITDIFDPALIEAFVLAEPGSLEQMQQLKAALDGYFEGIADAVSGTSVGLLAGIPKIFRAANRGCTRMVQGIQAQHEKLCGSGRRAARLRYPEQAATITLDRVYEGIATGDDSWTLLKDGAREELFRVDDIGQRSRAQYAISSKATELQLEPERASALRKRFRHRVRTTTAYVNSKPLTIAEAPLSDPVIGTIIAFNTIVSGLQTGQPIAISGRLANGDPAEELAFISTSAAAITEKNGRTHVRLAAALRHAYVRETVRINANVARATHGESVREIVGSGDASIGDQRFALKQSPLTHINAGTVTGRQSSLTVRVNDVQWAEVDTLIGAPPNAQVFTTSIDDDGKTSVLFGNGRDGARVPSGAQNIRAAYRKGIGVDGNVEGGRITSLLTRPAGVVSARNPGAAAGGQDPESAAAARENAPITVLTLGRAVSLRDYEDFARTFAGIAKASAVWIASGPYAGIALTVAGPDGARVDPLGETHRRLDASLRAFGDSQMRVTILPHIERTFVLHVAITIDPRAVAEAVLGSARTALTEWFGFRRRTFGQVVSIDEIAAVLHEVPFVVAVDVNVLHRDDEPPDTPSARIRADRGGLNADGSVGAAELLTIATAQLVVEMMP